MSGLYVLSGAENFVMKKSQVGKELRLHLFLRSGGGESAKGKQGLHIRVSDVTYPSCGTMEDRRVLFFENHESLSHTE